MRDLLSLSDGEPLWIVSHEARHQNPLGGIGPRSTPTIAAGRVYAQGATGRVWCLDLASGETEWTAKTFWNLPVGISWRRSWRSRGDAPDRHFWSTVCALFRMAAPTSNAETGRSLIAFDAETGATRWTSGEDQISFASPGLMTLGGKRQIVSVNETTITGHEVKDGSLLWEFDWPGQSNGGANCAMVIPAGENRFLIGKGYGGGSALVEMSQAKDGSLSAAAVWDSAQVLKTKFTHACVRGDVAFAISNGSLEAVRIDDAEQQWVQPRRSRFGQGQILLVEDTIVAQSESGEVTFVAADPDGVPTSWGNCPRWSPKRGTSRRSQGVTCWFATTAKLCAFCCRGGATGSDPMFLGQLHSLAGLRTFIDGPDDFDTAATFDAIHGGTAVLVDGRHELLEHHRVSVMIDRRRIGRAAPRFGLALHSLADFVVLGCFVSELPHLDIFFFQDCRPVAAANLDSLEGSRIRRGGCFDHTEGARDEPQVCHGDILDFDPLVRHCRG